MHGATLIEDRFGNQNDAYLFDGINDFIEIPNNGFLNFEYKEDFSISLWVNISSAQNDMRGQNNEILGKWNALRSSGYPYAIRYWNEKAAEQNKYKIFNLRYDTELCGHNPLITGDCYISREDWHHLVLVKKGNNLEYYQDEQLFGSTTDDTVLSCNTTNSNPIFIGKRDLNQRYFTGMIDDIAFYNRALTLSEISILFTTNGWEASPTPGLDITFFSLPNQISSSINNSNYTIDVIMPCNTDVSQLIPSFTVSNGSEAYINNILQISDTSVNNFNDPVSYNVSNEDICREQNWFVTIRTQTFDQDYIDSSTSILSYNIQGQIGPTEINPDIYEIQVFMPCNTDISNLVSLYSLSADANASVGGEAQENNSSVNNFEQSVIYTIASVDGCIATDWKVTILINEIDFDSIDLTHSDFFIPNVITPNDDGKNEFLKIGELLQGSEIIIFNRYGVNVYESLNYRNQFSGAKLSSGVYYYYINSYCIDEPIKGFLSILR